MSTPTPDLAMTVHAMIRERRQALEQLELALQVYERAFGPVEQNGDSVKRSGDRVKRRGHTLARKGRTVRRAPIPPGSVPSRILEILQEAGGPMKKAAIVEQARAKAYTVKLALKELVADGRIVADGATTARRYALA
jgi:hypothetical protein